MEILKLSWHDGAYHVDKPEDRSGEYVSLSDCNARIAALAAARERECKQYDCPYWGAEILRLRADLAAAREENERLKADMKTMAQDVVDARINADDCEMVKDSYKKQLASLRARDEGRVERLEDALRRWGVGGSMRDAILSAAAADGEVGK